MAATTKKTNPEERLQAACVEWFRYNYPWLSGQLVYVPNELAHGREIASRKRGARFEAPSRLGLAAGCSDLLLLVPRRGFGALCIEMKTPRGRVSERQLDWGVKQLENGNLYQVVRTFEDFKTIVSRYLFE